MNHLPDPVAASLALHLNGVTAREYSHLVADRKLRMEFFKENKLDFILTDSIRLYEYGVQVYALLKLNEACIDP